MPMTNIVVPMLGLKPTINIWEGGPITGSGKLTAVDTETLMIDFDKPSEYPEVVVLTAYGGGDVVDLVKWAHIPSYLEALLLQKRTLVFHNAPFDVGVLGIDQFVEHVDRGLIWDTGLQWILRKLNTYGLSDMNREYPKLSRVIMDLFGETLDKSADIRLTFNREDELDEGHMIYACGDAIATWRASMLMGPRETMDIQVKGFLTLDGISRMGILVDQDYMRATRNVHQRDADEASSALISWGIKTAKDPESSEIWEWMVDELELPLDEYTGAQAYPVTNARNLLYAALKATTLGEVIRWMGTIEHASGKSNPAEILDFVEGALTKRQVFGCLWRVLSNLQDRIAPKTGLQEYWESHQGWPPGYKQQSSAAALTGLMEEAEKTLGIDLPRTVTGKMATSDEALLTVSEKSLESLPFLANWKKFKHAENMISTFLDQKIVRPDGRVHTRFCPIVATGRTSSRGPNLQNLPQEEGIREHYIADPGYVINSCDYGQQELVALAQNCYSRYGYSRMKDLINNDIDIHGYVATRLGGLFQRLPDFNVDDLDIVKTYQGVIESFKTDDPDRFGHLRKLSKALNFGLPGGLGSATFVPYAKGYGVTISAEESREFCAAWKDTFPEMKEHLQPEPMLEVPDRFVARTLTGRLRVNCSFCAAANSVFQGFAADISKSAGWELYKEGFALINFIHDEYLSLIPYNHLITARSNHMREIMEIVMACFTPDVRCKAEPTLMFRWSKKAQLWVDGEGDITPWELVPIEEVGGKARPMAWDSMGQVAQTKFLDRKKFLWDRNAWLA